jgi:hypothetical protein
MLVKIFLDAAWLNPHQTSGTGVSPVQAQAKACGYLNSLFEGDSVLGTFA